MIGSAYTARKAIRSAASLLAFVAMTTFCCCANAQPVQTTADSVRSETTRGPVTVLLEFSPKEPRLSDEPRLTLTVTAEDGVIVTLPPFGESLSSFIIRDFYEPLPKTSSGKQILQQVYTLEPTAAGAISIDPLTVRFVDERSQGDGKAHEVQTEGLLIEVATIIDSEAPSLANLRPATDPVPLPSKLSSTAIAGTILSVLALLAVAFLIWKRMRPRAAVEPELTPQQLAWRELQELLGSKLSETDLKEFFVQLTAVVRRYIERTTGVKAPEQTTEEFLREVNSRKLFGDADNKRLEAFLESADLVKFAGYQPDADSIKDSTHRAKEFISLEAASANSADRAVAIEPSTLSTEIST